MDVHFVEARRSPDKTPDKIGFLKAPFWTPTLPQQRLPLLAMKPLLRA